MLAVVCVLLSILHGASSAENKHVVGDMSAAKQPSLGLGRKLGAVVADDLSALVFGNRTSNSGTCSIDGILESGFARTGEAFLETKAFSAPDCVQMCQNAVAGCIAINYRASDQTCSFFAELGYIYVSSGYATALVNPSLENVCNKNNMIYGYDRPGGDMPDSVFHFDTALECCWKCVTTLGCTVYAKSNVNRECKLKVGPPPLRQSSRWSTGLVCMD